MAEGIGLEIRQVGFPARGFKSPLLREKKELFVSSFFVYRMILSRNAEQTIL